MKLVLSLCLLFIGLNSNAQEVDAAEVNKIIAEIIAPLGANDVDKVLERTVFPFKVGDKNYSRTELKANFNDVFMGQLRSELKHASSYEAMNFEGDAYMVVCNTAPEGFDASVPTFEKINGKWMLSSIDLYEEE